MATSWPRSTTLAKQQSERRMPKCMLSALGRCLWMFILESLRCFCISVFGAGYSDRLEIAFFNLDGNSRGQISYWVWMLTGALQIWLYAASSAARFCDPPLDDSTKISLSSPRFSLVKMTGSKERNLLQFCSSPGLLQTLQMSTVSGEAQVGNAAFGIRLMRVACLRGCENCISLPPTSHHRNLK